ncbi:MAG: ABC transporter ATP-binding protein [Rhodothermales bacterium]|nr:ABC transporter ATP-binding protein [Rhodothermales bacterium]MBO6780023.1 ABC transporter ATP-binding protein [Rhodothermales bacterium]
MRVVQDQSPPLALEGVEKAFGPLRVIRGVDVTFCSGESVAIIGPNGAGKTTLIKIVLGLVGADAGEVEVFGESVHGAHAYRRYIGYMPQSPAFPEGLTGRELIELVRSFRPGVESVEADLIRRFALGEDLDKPASTLSGGTRQKLSAVLAFMFEPPVLILDEPTAGLDPVASASLKDYVRQRVQAGTTVLLTSHVMADLEELCSRVVFLMDGRIQFDGTLEGLQAKTGESRLERAIAQLLTREVA